MTATRTTTGGGPVEAQLRINREILEKEEQIRSARVIRRFARLAILVGPIGLASIYIATAITWRKIDLVIVNLPLIPLSLILTAFGVVFHLQQYIPKAENTFPSIGVLELDLALLHERRRMQASVMDVGSERKRSAYKVEIAAEVQNMRGQSKYYRRVNNLLQAVIIVGSLASTAVAGLSLQLLDLRWATVATTFTVGAAAGFLGYYKFRERGYYLQQTADSLEYEWNAVELGIGRYKGRSDADALCDFVEEAERLRNEQRKREQNLDQPSDRDPDKQQ